jgi:glycerophosphoryl diester phosphodiesterase
MKTVYSHGKLIAHAGGLIKGKRYTNSVEALERAHNLFDLIELDVCRAADGLIVAHDGLEWKYGLTASFAETTVADFTATSFDGTLRPMSVRDLISKMPQINASVILDIKARDQADYDSAIAEIARYCDEFGMRDKVIVQVYSPQDFASTEVNGMTNIILALWKNYHSIRSDKCRHCVEQCFNGEVRGFRAMSIRAAHFWRDGEEVRHDIIDYYSELSPMIFLHGQDAEIEENLLNRGFGLFTHTPEKLLAVGAIKAVL